MDLHHDTLFPLGIARADRAVAIGAAVATPPRTTWKGTPLHERWLTDPDSTPIKIHARLTPEEPARKPLDEGARYLVASTDPAPASNTIRL